MRFSSSTALADAEDTLEVVISGTATNDLDYETIDPEVIMEVVSSLTRFR